MWVQSALTYSSTSLLTVRSNHFSYCLETRLLSHRGHTHHHSWYTLSHSQQQLKVHTHTMQLSCGTIHLAQTAAVTCSVSYDVPHIKKCSGFLPLISHFNACLFPSHFGPNKCSLHSHPHFWVTPGPFSGEQTGDILVTHSVQDWLFLFSTMLGVAQGCMT